MTVRALPIAIAAVLTCDPAKAAVPIDPQGLGAIVNAVNWLQGTLLGSVATVVAVIAVAQVGFMTLTGRIDWRHGARVILGCFILFGAPVIASSFAALARGSQEAAPVVFTPEVPPLSYTNSPQPELYERCPAGWCRKFSLQGWPP